MKNFASLILSGTIAICMGFGFSSCKEDEPPAKPKLSFAKTEITVNEDDGVLEVELVLDKAHSKDLRIEYELGGTADDQDIVGTANADYEVQGSHGVVKIEAGQTTGVIELDIYPDAGFEEDETIEIAILDTNTDEIELTADDEVVITIKNDDAQLVLSFVNPDLTVNEADGVLEVQLVLDKPAPRDLTFSYELSGSATDSITAWNNKVNPDYYVNGTSGQFQIRAGETTGLIDLRVYSDLLVEDANQATEAIDPETIVITVGTNGVQMADNEIEIKLVQEDGLLIALLWPDPANALQADMDLLLRVGNSTSSWLGVLTGSAAEGFQGPEIIFIPKVITYAAYGLSHTYYDGTLDPLKFKVLFIDIIDSALEPQANILSYEATYTAANKNKWTDVSSTQVVQTFEKNATGFTTPSQITVPTAGSRVRSTDKFTSNFERHEIQHPRSVYNLLKEYGDY